MELDTHRSDEVFKGSSWCIQPCVGVEFTSAIEVAGAYTYNTKYFYQSPFFSGGVSEDYNYIVKTINHNDGELEVVIMVCRDSKDISVYVIFGSVTCKFAEFKFRIGNEERVVVKKRDMVSSKTVPQIKMSNDTLGSWGVSDLLVSYRINTRDPLMSEY
jgi:hypothetical protein